MVLPYEKIEPEIVEAEKFTGWASALQIMDLIPGTLFVGKGYDHPLRNNWDPGNEEFLVLTHPLSREKIRVNAGFYIVKHQNGYLDVLDDKTFSTKFRLSQTQSSGVVDD